MYKMMNLETKEQLILAKAIDAFQRTTGLQIDHVWQDGPADALLTIQVPDQPIHFFAEIKGVVDRFKTLTHIRELRTRTKPVLLVAPFITKEIAAQCRELDLPFIDEAGNAYMKTPGLFVYVVGQARPERTHEKPEFTALTTGGLKIVFALLNQNKIGHQTYREIATFAKVALGTVGPVLTNLENRGFLTPAELGPRRILDKKRLEEEWVTHYPIKLRPKLNARRFTATKEDWYKGINIEQYDAYWGGEIAAEKLTGYLKPAKITIYARKNLDRLIVENRLRPDVHGEIEILEAFWAADTKLQMNGVVPALLVYADLLATTNPRNIETARLIYDQYLTQA
jgi:hypothetical protein